MRKLFLLMFALLTGVSGAWAQEVLPTASVASWMYDSSDPFLTLKTSDDATITTADDGDIIIHASNLCTVDAIPRSYAAVAMVVNMPDEAPGAFADFFCLKAADNYTGAIGLGVTTDKKLKGTWDAASGNKHAYGPTTTNAVTGEHTIIMLCNNSGTTIYVDQANTSVNGSGLKCGTQWTDLRIESAYKNCVKKVFVFNGEQSGNISSIFSELAAFNLVTVANGETKAVSNNSTAYFNVEAGGTLTVDVADYELNKVFGSGGIVLDANTSLTGGKYTLVTGKLTVNEGKTLTIGGGDTQTNSIASFTSIDLAGTIKHNNSVATLNNVTVPADKTGKIFAYDMGSDADGFNLAGTTTLNGNLTICSSWNAQIKVDELAGSGTWLICGTTGESFDETKTASDQAAVINVAAATTFTGTINVNNTNAAATISGDLGVCEIKKTRGTVNYAGNKLNGTTLDGVVLSSTTNRVSTSGIVNIKNLAGCNLPNNNSESNYGYAFVGSGTINFYGICDLTKKADGTDALSSNLGYGSSATIVVKENATLKAGVLFNTRQSENNASITVESGGTLTAIGWTHDNGVLYAKNLVNNGTVNISTGRLTSGYGISTIHNTLSGSGTLNIAEGANLEVSSVPNTITLSGSGDVKLTTFPGTTAPTLTDWTGTINFPSPASDQANLQAIFNAWGNSNSTIKLHSVTGWLPGGDVNPTLQILEGEILTINNGSSSTTPVLKHITGAGILQQTWSGGSSYTLKVEKLTKFTGTLKGTNKPIEVDKLVLDDAPAVDSLLITTSGTVTLNELWLGLQKTEVYKWETKTVGNVTGIYVTSSDPVQLAKESAANDVAPYSNFIGTGVGKYTISLGNDKKYNSKEDFLAALDAWTTVNDYTPPIVTINQPTSAFYRIKSGSKYLQDARKSDSETQRTLTDAEGSNAAVGTVFYLDDNTLIGYKTGYGFGFSVCQTQDTEQLNTMLFTESAEMGKYTIQSQQGTYASADHNEGYWGVDGSDLSRVNDAASGACWTLEAVSSLPVTISAAGYATFNSPVAVEIPQGITAYQASVQDANSIRLVSIDDDVIPANFPVVLKGPEGTYTFNITTTDLTKENYHANELKGSIAAKSVSKGEIYTLQRDSETSVGFYPNAGTTFKGFSAYLTSGSGSRGFQMVSSTGIEHIATPILFENAYDLQGRKAGIVKKGVYIVNGKKVLF